MQLNQWKSLLTTSQPPLQLTHSVPGQPLPTGAAENAPPAAKAFLEALLSQRSAQQASDRGQSMQNPKLYETLQTLADRAASGEIGGIGVFWADPNGYSCFISNISGDAFGLFGYIRAASQLHMQNFLTRGLQHPDEIEPPSAFNKEDGPGPLDDNDDETEDYV